MLKATIVVMLLATLVSLFSGLAFLIKDDGQQRRVVNLLTIRIGLSAITLALISWGFISGALTSQAPW